MAEKWKVSGAYFETCNCDVTCQCIFGSNTTEGNCKVVVGWHIEQGRYEGAVLDGLNAAMLFYSPGEMEEGHWQAALYVDKKASEAQKNGLTQIFLGKAEGKYFMTDLMPAVEKVYDVSSKEINYQAKGRNHKLEIVGVSMAEIEAVEGYGGNEVTLTNLPGRDGFPMVQARSKQFSYHDHGFNWEISNKSGYYARFAYQPG